MNLDIFMGKWGAILDERPSFNALPVTGGYMVVTTTMAVRAEIRMDAYGRTEVLTLLYQSDVGKPFDERFTVIDSINVTEVHAW